MDKKRTQFFEASIILRALFKWKYAKIQTDNCADPKKETGLLTRKGILFGITHMYIGERKRSAQGWAIEFAQSSEMIASHHCYVMLHVPHIFLFFLSNRVARKKPFLTGKRHFLGTPCRSGTFRHIFWKRGCDWQAASQPRNALSASKVFSVPPRENNKVQSLLPKRPRVSKRLNHSETKICT